MLCPIKVSGTMQPANSEPALQHHLPEATLLCRRQHVLSKLSEQQSLLSGGQEVWQLPGGLSWNDTSRVVLRYVFWLALQEPIITSALGAGSFPWHCLGVRLKIILSSLI